MGAITTSSKVFGWIRQGKSLQSIGLILIIVVQCLIFSFLHPAFFSALNFFNILTQMVSLSILAMGVTFVLVCGGIDLSMGSIMSITSVITAMALVATESIPIAIVVGILTGIAFGVVNGYFVAYRRIQPFAVTLGTMSVAAGLALVISNGTTVRGLPQSFAFIGRGQLFGVPAQVYILLVVFILCYLLLHKMPFGTLCFSVGGNLKAAELSGVSARSVKMRSFIISGGLAAVAAIIATSRTGSGFPNMGAGAINMQALAAAVIGGASLGGGRGAVASTIMGALFITILNNGANLVRVSPHVQDVMIGGIIIASAWIDHYRRKRMG